MDTLSSYVIVGAGGKGERMGCNKQLLELEGKPVFIRTLEAFDNHPLIDGIILVRPQESKDEFHSLVDKFKIKKVIAEADAGKERQFSMYNGLQKVPKCSVVLFHNGANPLVTDREITETIKEAYNKGAAVVALPVKDTIKIVKDGKVVKTLNRSELWAMQTPQAIRYEIALNAYEFVIKNNLTITDDVQAVELFNNSIPISIVPAAPQNIKLTTPLDLIIAKSYLGKSQPAINFEFVYGIGEDSHEFQTINEHMDTSNEKHLVLGGVIISREMSFKANSDGDVILHAVSRAILSAIAGPQIDYFADELAKNGVIDSKVYLANILKYAKEKGYVPNELRIVIEGKQPKLKDHINLIRSSLASLLSIPEEKVGIIAHSGEGLSDFGRGQGVRCISFVSMKKNNS